MVWKRKVNETGLESWLKGNQPKKRSNLPPAPCPFIPPEIVARILHFIEISRLNPPHQGRPATRHQELGPVALINRDWRLESQKLLFESIKLTSSKRIRVRNPPTSLYGFIKSLEVNYSESSNPAKDAQLIFQILLAAPLKFLSSSTKPPFTSFGPADMIIMESSPILAHLTTLHLATTEESWNRILFDSIISSAPNIEVLHLGFGRYGPVMNHQGPLWNSKPSKLQKLMVEDASVLEGNVFDISTFEGLESLVYLGKESMNLDLVIPFFEIVGPSLLTLAIPSISLPFQLIPLLPILEDLTLHTTGIAMDEDSNILLPSSLIRLSIQAYASGRHEDPPVADTFDLLRPASWINLSQLEEIEFGFVHSWLKLDHLPPLKVLSIAAHEEDYLIDELNALVVGAVPCQKLKLWNIYGVDDYGNPASSASYEPERAGELCWKLGIELIYEENLAYNNRNESISPDFDHCLYCLK